MKAPQTESISYAEILAEIQSSLAAGGCDKVPSGWLTTEQWARQWDKSSSHANNLLVAAHRSGLMERQQFRIILGDSKKRPIWHYKPKAKAKKK